jgi:hypothetical protein
LMPDGRFNAEQVQAKCASKYEAAPQQNTPASGAKDAYPNSQS